MRVFYVVAIEDDYLRSLLDGIRVLCDPREKHHAHITVRGPYEQRYHFHAQNRLLQNSEVQVSGPGCFFGERQNTVFLKCESKVLEKVWYKPDYPAYTPHLTIYNGVSRAFAEQLLQILSKHAPQFSFHVSGLLPLITTRGQEAFLLATSIDWGQLSNIVDKRISFNEIESYTIEERLKLIEVLVAHLATCTQETLQSSTHRSEGSDFRSLNTDLSTAYLRISSIGA